MTKLLEELKVNINIEFLEGELPELVNKIKAAGIREATFETRTRLVDNGSKWLCRVDDLLNHADKLEGNS